MEMEECVWSKYPEELHMAILIRLPWIDKLRLRRVCVLWNTILRDPSLLKCSRSPAGSLPFCCLSPSNGGEIQLCRSRGRIWHAFTSSTNFKVIAAASGLLLMEGSTDVKRTLILLNPLNRTQRRLYLPQDLEDIVHHQSCIFQMTMEKETDNLKILAGLWLGSVDDNARNMHLRKWHSWMFYVYNLESNSWQLVADVCLRDEGYPLCTILDQRPTVTLVGDDLYLLSTFHGTSTHLYRISPTSQPPRPTKLEPQQDLVIGGDSQLPLSSSYIESKLFESEGRLLLIVSQKFRIGAADDRLNNFWQLSMYEFDFVSSEWKVAMEMPAALARSRTFVTFDINAGYVCFHNNDFTVMCKISSKTWILLPPPLRPKTQNPPIQDVFLFEPRLDIIL